MKEFCRRIITKPKRIALATALTAAFNSTATAFAAGVTNGINTNVTTGQIAKAVLMIIGGVVVLIGLFICVPGIVKYIMAHRSNNGDAQADAAKDVGVGAALIGVGAALALGSGPIMSLFF